MSTIILSLQGYPRGLFFLQDESYKSHNKTQSRNKCLVHKLRLFLLFGLRRVWLSSFRAVTVGCRKRFLCPEAVYRYCEWAKKRLKEQKQTMTKAATHAKKRELRLFFCSLVCAGCGYPFSRAVTVGCRKRFLCPEAVYRYCEWAKKRLKEQK